MFEPAPNATVANRYRLVREIGRGGMGAVWEAFDHELDAPCALKFILNQSVRPPEVRARFLREARAVARLQSPHVVNIRSVGEWEGTLYIAMELLAGETLFDRLTRLGTLSRRDTSRIVDQVASVLTLSHAAGIVHRDLKPENIWLWSHGDVFVKVLDFGVAKQVEGDNPLLKTATGMLVGTPYYMSPEQAAGDRQVDHRSDIWSLAIIAAECLGGRRPFQTSGLGQLLASIISGPTPAISELYPQAPPALDAWWAQATAKDPNARYGSARAMADGLAIALEVRQGSDPPRPEVRSQPGAQAKRVGPPAATSSLSPVTAQQSSENQQSSEKTTTQVAQAPDNLFGSAEPPVARPLAETLPTPDPSSRSVSSETAKPPMAAPAPVAPTATSSPTRRFGLAAGVTVAAIALAWWVGRGPAAEATGDAAAPQPPSTGPGATSVGAVSSAASSHHVPNSPLELASATAPSAGGSHSSPPGKVQHAAAESTIVTPTAVPPTPGTSSTPAPARPSTKPTVIPRPKPVTKPEDAALQRRIGF